MSKYFTTKRDARAWLAETRTDVKRGDYQAKSADTLDTLCDRWLHDRRDVRAVTVRSYRDLLAPVRRRLGDRKVQTISDDDLNALVEWMTTAGGQRGQGLSPRTVSATLGALSQVLGWAVTKKIVPMPALRAPRTVQARGRLALGSAYRDSGGVQAVGEALAPAYGQGHDAARGLGARRL